MKLKVVRTKTQSRMKDSFIVMAEVQPLDGKKYKFHKSVTIGEEFEIEEQEGHALLHCYPAQFEVLGYGNDSKKTKMKVDYENK